MDLPEGWRVGHTKDVSPQWAEQWAEYAGKARNEADLEKLRFVLEDRKSWLLPRTVRQFSQALENRAGELSCDFRPVRSMAEEKPWHERLTDFPDGPKPTLSQKSKRMAGERD